MAEHKIVKIDVDRVLIPMGQPVSRYLEKAGSYSWACSCGYGQEGVLGRPLEPRLAVRVILAHIEVMK